ncbi:phosphatidylserine decarboxylase [Salinisphaera aquimarina]|uniref:Phosphatidylserine decarboxylase n=1 Tax=Salinisphaera aquimarina TaxID=2094031 RepID=A0ABV7ET23_9GAMM
MRRKTLFHIVPEGWAVLIGLTVAFFIVNAAVGLWWAIPLLVLIVAAILYFRDSPRNVPAEPLAVIAPVDGTVVHRRECYDPFLDREAIKVSLRVDVLGAYLLRSPVEGTVLELTGEAVDKLDGVASRIRTDEGDDLVMVIREGSLFGARPCRSSFGERVGQGRCCGQRRLARRVELYLPVNSRVEVELGTHVKAGACVLAKLVHKQSAAPRGDSGDAGHLAASA